MIKEKACKIVVYYLLVLGLLSFSPIIIIIYSFLTKRIKTKTAAVGPMLSAAIIYGLLNLIFVITAISIIIELEEILTGFIGIILCLLFSGVPFIYSIRYLIEEKKNPTPVKITDAQRLEVINELQNANLIKVEEYESWKNNS